MTEQSEITQTESDILSPEDKRTLCRILNPSIYKVLSIPCHLIYEIHFEPKTSSVAAVIKYIESKSSDPRSQVRMDCSNNSKEVKIKIARAGSYT